MFRFILSKTFLIQLCLAALVAGSLLIGAYLYLQQFTRSGEAVSVPELIGSDIIEAEALLKQSDLRAVVIDSLYVQDKRGGVILDQNPPELSSVKTGREIYLTVSRYKTPQVEVPNVLDQTMAIAINKLTRRGFEIGELIPQSNPCEGCAVGLELNDKSVEIGSKLPKGSKIDLVVGENSSNAIVATPILYGLNFDEAKTLLNKYQLNEGAIIYSDCESDSDSLSARVYWQSINPNSDARIGEAINIKLSPNLDLIPPVNVDSIKSSIL